MTLKRNISIYTCVFFSVLFGITTLTVYLLFASFRQEEFKDRLEEKAITSIKLLVEVKEIDKQLQRLIDENTINKLYNEKTLLFNDNLELIYSSVDDAVINWSHEDLKQLKNEKSFFKSQGEYDVYGIYYDSQKVDYYALISAEDKYGKRKLNYLKYLLIGMFVTGTAIVWIGTFYFIRSLISPLDLFQKKITEISEKNLTFRLAETERKDEINLMAKAFNQMMFRIENSYKKQAEFTSNASHELRTPVARIIAQLENLLTSSRLDEATITYLKRIEADAGQMAELIHSLLLLSQIEEQQFFMESKRLDEIIFDAMAAVKKIHADFQVTFSILDNERSDFELELNCNESLLQIVFLNLLRNAYQYSTDQKASIELEQVDLRQIIVKIRNTGPQLDHTEQDKLYEAFMRGKNAYGKSGTGLGLRITKRILDHHHAQIRYLAENAQQNLFEITFAL